MYFARLKKPSIELYSFMQKGLQVNFIIKVSFLIVESSERHE